MFNIIFYESNDGKCPIENFLNSLDMKMRAKVLREISLLQEFGNDLREPHSKYLRDGIFELRIKFSNNITRVLYFFYHDEGQKIILTNGFVKKDQKPLKTR